MMLDIAFWGEPSKVSHLIGNYGLVGYHRRPYSSGAQDFIMVTRCKKQA